MKIMTQKVAQKRKASESVCIEDIYKNKNFVKPKEKPLETIFEEPKVSKDGIEHYTSIKRYKRYLHFDEYPTTDKLRKRKNRAKKYSRILANDRRNTRSEVKRNEHNNVTLEESFPVVDNIDCLQVSSTQDSLSNVELTGLDENHLAHSLSNSNFTDLRIEELEYEEESSQLHTTVGDDAIDCQKLNQCVIIEEPENEDLTSVTVIDSLLDNNCVLDQINNKDSVISIEELPCDEKIDTNITFSRSNFLETNLEDHSETIIKKCSGIESSAKSNADDSHARNSCEIT